MIRSDAVIRIQDALGFSSRQSAKIILRLQEAQRDLERGKTLPKFLLQEAQALVLASGTHSTVLPTGFLRVDDDNLPYFFPTSSTHPTRISIKRSYQDAFDANYETTPQGPKVAVITRTTIDFINTAPATYNLVWNYYKAADILTTDNTENVWLANAADWLIGFAGLRMARDVRDPVAQATFQTMMAEGRAACFGEIIAAEESSGPLVMGGNL